MSSLIVLLFACRNKEMEPVDTGQIALEDTAEATDTAPPVDSEPPEDTDPPDTDPPEDTAPVDPDEDGDGYAASVDCDDGNSEIHPAADESCNGLDDDCDGEVDEDAGDAATWYIDVDGDGHGSEAYTEDGCEAPDGYVAEADDCDDTDASAFPGANEACDGVDDDCDGEIDENADDAGLWYADADGDGWGDAATSSESCEAATGYVADATDCDDGDAAVNPDADEVCNELDDDCDGLVDDDDEVTDASTWYADADGDGFGAGDAVEACDTLSGHVPDGSDCDDSDPAVNPDADEVCNEIDDDCDGLVDDDDTSLTDAGTWHLDHDGDGFGDAAYALDACEAPTGYVADATDCDDLAADAHPEGDETCDGTDQDCDGSVDEDASDASTWYADADGDGFGDASSSTTACEASGHVANDDDCDDTDAGVTDGETFHADADGDGYGDPDNTETACSASSGYVDDDQDCDDDDASLNPDTTWYLDHDSDGYGDADWGWTGCEQPSGYVASDTDCDDGEAGVNPGATETCDGVDEDCDGDTDEGYPADIATFYADTDGDGFGDPDDSLEACDETSGYVSDATDGDDDEATAHPGASELCDGLDNDCDGVDDTLGYWPFETGSGSVAYDAGDLGLDGTIASGSWTTGSTGNGLAFDGTNTNVVLDYDELGATTGLTVSAWVSPDSLRSSSWDSVVSRGAAASSALSCCRDSYYLGYYQHQISWYTDTSSFQSPLLDGEDHSGHVGSWHHLVGVWDMATGERAIYVDGVETASDTSGPLVPEYDGTPTRIGADTNSGAVATSITFDGVIDEVKIFGCAVDATQAATDYADGWPF